HVDRVVVDHAAEPRANRHGRAHGGLVCKLAWHETEVTHARGDDLRIEPGALQEDPRAEQRDEQEDGRDRCPQRWVVVANREHASAPSYARAWLDIPHPAGVVTGACRFDRTDSRSLVCFWPPPSPRARSRHPSLARPSSTRPRPR